MRRRCRRRRHIEFDPHIKCYKPCGVSMSELGVIMLRKDEYEALRLADYEGFYQEECSERMNISRTTFARIIESARKKVAEALVYGKVLMIGEEDDL